MYRLTLFDIDGTLIKRHSKTHRESFINIMGNVYGLDISLKDWGDYPGWTDQLIIIDILRKKGLAESEIEDKIEECIRKIVVEFNQLLPGENIRLLEGVPELLNSLDKNGILIGLVTGNFKGIAYGKMKQLGLDTYFKIGGFGDDAKSRTDLVKKAIERASPYGNFSLDKICVFGDTPLDIIAAQEAGVAAIAVATGAYSVEELKEFEPYHIFKDLSNTQKVMALISQQPF